MEEIIFPNQIRMIRRTRGKTMKELASVLGVSLSAISKIEKGYRRIDEDQLQKIVTFLNCPKESVFVYEQMSQPEVILAWQKEQERRKQINEKSGLKTLGAGLRYIRGQKMLTLSDVASGAGLTLSVYHRIEMGQREVTESQFEKIAHALGYTAEDLQIQIYELDMSDALKTLKKSNLPGIFHPKGGYNDLPLNVSLLSAKKIPVYGSDKEGAVVIKEGQAIHYLNGSFEDVESMYAIQLTVPSLGNMFPLFRTILIVDTKADVQKGDFVALRKNEGVRIGIYQEKEDGTSVVVSQNPVEEISVTDEDSIEKITYIHIS
jgi:transcriptional regulator with XRE-family HTH domain